MVGKIRNFYPSKSSCKLLNIKIVLLYLQNKVEYRTSIGYVSMSCYNITGFLNSSIETNFTVTTSSNKILKLGEKMSSESIELQIHF